MTTKPDQADALKPCPFCGSPARLYAGGEYWVSCTKIGVCIGNHKRGGCTYREDAIKLWNTRAPEPEGERFPQFAFNERLSRWDYQHRADFGEECTELQPGWVWRYSAAPTAQPEAEPTAGSGEGEAVDYSTPTPETDAFLIHIDDSEIDMSQVEAKLQDFEHQRDSARAATSAAEQALRKAEMPWASKGTPCKEGVRTTWEHLAEYLTSKLRAAEQAKAQAEQHEQTALRNGGLQVLAREKAEQRAQVAEAQLIACCQAIGFTPEDEIPKDLAKHISEEIRTLIDKWGGAEAERDAAIAEVERLKGQ